MKISAKSTQLSLSLLFLFLLFTTSAHAADQFIFKNNLKLGQTHADVLALQKYLNNTTVPVALKGIGSKGKETMVFGQATKAALIKFQTQSKINPALGYFGPVTRNFINKKLLTTTNTIKEVVPVTASNTPVVIVTPKTEEKKIYSVSGNITGIAGDVILRNNNGDDITIKVGANSEFYFPTKLATGDSYEVTVIPVFSGQKCYTHDNKGIITGANINSVKIACGANLTYNPFTYIPPSNSVMEKLSLQISPTSSRLALTFARQGDSAPVGTPITLNSSKSNSDIYYTINNSEPNKYSPQYTAPILVNSDLTIKAFAKKTNYLNSDVISGDYLINQSEGGIFSNPHGTVQAGNKFYVGTRTSPATVTVFNNPDDLSDHQTVTLTGHSNIDVLIYDDVNDKLYASCYDGLAYENPHKMTIIQIDPHDITQWSVIFSNAALWTQWSTPIVTDGTYIYGATFGYNPSEFFKIRISDGAIITRRGWTGVYYSHSAVIQKYADRSEMYVTTVWDHPARFAKVNLTDMTYTSVSFGNNDPYTDDMACRYVDETGSICYAGADEYAVSDLGLVIDTRTMATSSFPMGGTTSYGMFIKDSNLYSLNFNNTITRFPNFNTTTPEIFSTPGITPNEMFYSDSGKLFITDWSASSKLIEFKLAD